jgi:hypothetical protein
MIPTFGLFRVAFDGTSPEAGNFAQRSSESDGCDPLAPIMPVNEEASDPPIRKVVETIEISSLILDAGKLFRVPELTPADRERAVVHEGGVSSAVLNSPFLLRSILRRSPVGEPSLAEVKGHAPAATPYAVVLLDQPGKIRPGSFVQRLDVEASHETLENRRSHVNIARTEALGKIGLKWSRF